MSIKNKALIPPKGLIHTTLESIASQLTSICDYLRYQTRLAHDEKLGDKTIYLEVAPSEVIAEGISPTIQSSFKDCNIRIAGIIRDDDTRVAADFAEEIITTLLSSASFEVFRNAFATDSGFAIERISHVAVESGDNRSTWSQIDLAVNVSFHLNIT